jgi:hypothetical protein
MMGVPLYADDLLEACAPWGNVCIVAGTRYIPIALPSIVASLFLFAPLVVAFLKLQAAEAQLAVAQRDAARHRASVQGNATATAHSAERSDPETEALREKREELEKRLSKGDE